MKSKFKLNRIGLKSLDRSGSNLILALFHYHDEFYSLTEKFEYDTYDYEALPDSKPVTVFRSTDDLDENLALETKISPGQKLSDIQINSLLNNKVNNRTRDTIKLNSDILKMSDEEAFYKMFTSFDDSLQYHPAIRSAIQNGRISLDGLGDLNVTYTPEKPKNDWDLLNWLHSQNYSMFFGTDFSIKKLSNVRNLVLKIPKKYIWDSDEHRNNYDHAQGPYCTLDYVNHKYNKKIYLIRNPFRVALSFRPDVVEHASDNAYWAMKKPKDMLILKEIVDYTAQFITDYKKDIENGLDSKLIFLEYFLKNLGQEAPNLINWSDSSVNCSVQPHIGRIWLNSHENGEALVGDAAGNFNPRHNICYKRTLNKDIHEFYINKKYLDDDLKNYVKNKLGNMLYDYWFNDSEHYYQTNINVNLI